MQISGEHIRPIDQAVLDLLRQNHGLSVSELISYLEVTATAVRQRLDRLVQVELIERRKESVGRGRPQYRYFLTPLGVRYAAASYADLASALWQEIIDLPNPQQRSRILRRVARRMGEKLRSSMPLNDDMNVRLQAMAAALGKQKVPANVNAAGELPVLEVLACPFPELAEHDESRQLCELEQEMLSEAVGQSMQLDCCRLDGHQHCHFRPVPGLSLSGPVTVSP
ncbi:MAG: replication-relaxation family protein [Planctomycetales bacterium]|nr:replication-relaxation family protein [Planctomycetales bacterium]